MKNNENIMNTYNYKCLNGFCENRSIIQVSKIRAEKDNFELCIRCRKPMKLMGETYNCFATFGSKTPEQKKEIIKKRANDHNKTKMKDRVQEVRKKFLK